MKTVALYRRIHYCPEFRYKRKFIGEAKALSGLRHKGIVSVSDVFEENGTAYFVMDYIEGQTLANLCKDGPLPEKHALYYMRQVCEALAYVHDHNRLHLDLKPGNIMVEPSGRIVLIDFGVSKQYDIESGENSTTLLGYTPGYAPLEQTQSNVRQFLPATDIYALGATLYRLLTGHTPLLPGDRLNEEDDLKFPTGISTATRHAVERALEIRKKDRPQSVRDFVALLDAAVGAVRPVSSEPAEKPKVAHTAMTVAAWNGETEGVKPKGRSAWQKLKALKMWQQLAIGACLILIIIGGFVLTGSLADPSDANADSGPAQKSVASVVDDDGDKVYTVYGVTFRMKPVAGGTFTMGATSEQVAPWNDEMPTHTVTLSDYYIGETEVTQELWQAVMGSNPSSFTGDLQCPVERVSWNDCQTFIKKLSELTDTEFRLPTEAEWEYAARGGKSSRGCPYSGSQAVGDVAWHWNDASKATHPVRTKSPNELGLYDMSGNVWEWCADRYGLYNSASQTNPQGPKTGTRRVHRGGSWYNYARSCQVAVRNSSAPDSTSSGLGLRCAFSTAAGEGTK